MVSDCDDFRAKQVLEFLISIMYLEKPTRVTVTVGNTVFGALLGDQPEIGGSSSMMWSPGWSDWCPRASLPWFAISCSTFTRRGKFSCRRNWRPTPLQWRWSSMTVLWIRNLIRKGLRHHHIPDPTDHGQLQHQRGAGRRRH